MYFLLKKDDDNSDNDSSGWATFIGIVICLCGNVIISFALNLQRLAHERIQRKIASRTSRPRSNRQSSENENGRQEYGSNRSNSSKDDDDPDADVEGTRYLKSSLWWTGLVLMVIGETGNFVAYGFAPASIVAPLGTVAILCNAVIAPVVFHEKFRLRDFTGIVLATAGAVTIVLSAKTQEEKLSPEDIWEAITQIPFLIYFVICSIVALVLVYLSRRHGEKSITIDLGLVAIFGGFTALSTKGISSLLTMSFYRIFTFPIAYLLLFVLTTTAILQVKYLNKALARFSSTQVIPTQFVMFTLSVVVGSAILYKDFNSATPERMLKFIFGCISTFIGVYLITSKRHTHHLPKPRHSIPHLRPDPPTETAPLLVISPASEISSTGLGETPPQFLGTSFGYHFTNPRIMVHSGSSTIPRGRKRDGDLASAIWSRWRHSDDHEPNLSAQDLARTQSERVTTSNIRPLQKEQGRTQSEVLPASGNGLARERGWGGDDEMERDERGSWGRSRGYSVV